MRVLIGVDEVGRGSWAGPLLIVAANAKTTLPVGLKDSKLLSKARREELFEQIKSACNIGEGWVQPEEIDKFGLSHATRTGVSRALLMIGAETNADVIIDGHINYCPKEYIKARAIINADETHPIVSAASIYAKVLRDRYMTRLAQIYPLYGFDQHVGYGTHFHQLMLKVYGPCDIHRKSYKPVADVVAAHD